MPPVNQFTCTEGLTGQSDPDETILTFASDICLAELVDADNQPVPDGTPSAKVLLTNLSNHTWPLIRYELTDRFTAHPAAPGRGYLRATVEGRTDDTFQYGTIAVDPLVIRTVMVQTRAALEYKQLGCPTPRYTCGRSPTSPATRRPARPAGSSPQMPPRPRAAATERHTKAEGALMLGFVTGASSGVGQAFACRLAADGWDLYHKATHSQIRPRRFGARDRALGSRCSGGCDPLAKAALQELAAGKRLVDSPVASQPVSPLGLRHQIIRGEACRGLGL